MNIQPVTLEGSVVRMETLTARHAEDLATNATPDIFVYTFPPPDFTPHGLATYIEDLRGRANFCPFAMILKETGEAVGVSCFMDIQNHNRALEIGSTWIAKQYQGTKVNPEAKLLMLHHAFEEQGALRVQLKTDSRNLQSQRAIEKLGAVREGILRKHMIMPGNYQRDSVMYSITDDEWPAVKAKLLARIGKE
jgi:N-acetyltransferase